MFTADTLADMFAFHLITPESHYDEKVMAPEQCTYLPNLMSYFVYLLLITVVLG